MTAISRRTVLGGAAAVSAATIAGISFSASARAAQPLSGKASTGYFRRKIGEIEVTSIHDGIWLRDADAGFVRNADFAEVQKALATLNAPAGKVPIPFTPLAVNTGSKLVLLDTGTGGRLAPTAGNYMDNFAASGLDTKAVGIIAISHFHPDHINGIRAKDESLVFPNADGLVARMGVLDERRQHEQGTRSRTRAFMNARRVFKDLGERIKQFEPGKEIVPGVNSIAAPGHTPGHTAFAVSSGGQTLLHIVDSANIAVFVKNPGWHVVFDANPAQAEASRRKLLDMAVTDKLLVSGYHLPFPGAFYVTKSGDGFRLQPALA